MEFSELLAIRRTVRLFKQQPVSDSDLLKLIDAARQASCSSNRQRLRYMIVRTPELVEAVLEKTAWAGLVKPLRTPQWGKNSPAAFIVLTAPEDDNSSIEADAGAAVQSIEFAATDMGLGACWLGAIDRAAIREILDCGRIVYLVAVGYPDETPYSKDINIDESCAYHIDSEGNLCVPKFKAEAITVFR